MNEVYYAISENNVEKVKTLLDSGNYFNPDSEKTNSYLYEACRYKKIEIIKLLFQYPQIDVNEKIYYSISESSILYYLCSKSNEGNTYLEVIKLLLSNPDIDVNSKNGMGIDNSPLHITKNIDVVELLLSHPNINVNVQNSKGETPLMRLLLSSVDDFINTRDAVVLLLEHPNIDVNVQDNKGLSAIKIINNSRYLYIACIVYRDIKLIRLLLRYPDINVNNKKIGDNILLTSLKFGLGYDNIVKELLQHPNLDVNGIGQKIPLLSLINSSTRNELTKLFIEHPKINVNVKDKNGNSILLLALIKTNWSDNKINIIKLLLSHPDIDVNSKNKESQTPFSVAYEKGLVNDERNIVSLIVNHPKFNVSKEVATLLLKTDIYKKYKDIYLLLEKVKQKNKENLNKILDNIEE